MATKSKRHIHKYHRVTLAFAEVWACGLPDCLHYLPQHMEEMAKGKQSICWCCGERIILDPLNMRDKEPKCLDCSSGAVAADSGRTLDKETLSEIEKRFLESGNIV